ncbi:MAG: sortase [Methanobacterium sp.]|uniref:sortase domain-containing protein n=1 Tax=Methanobacterium sp. TaxID=2164 RepID=UPI003C74F651
MSAPVNALDPTNTFDGTSIGELIIPKLGVDCSIRSDTVNAYNAVYHYPQSVGFRQPGEVGLLGHRTTYSHLSINIGTLKIGDKAIIIDTATQKKYTYVVTSNGNDIR